MKNVLMFCMLITVPILSYGATIQTTSSGGSFNNTATWVGGVVPGENDDVQVVNGATLTIDNDSLNYTINSLTILNGGVVNFSVLVDSQTVVLNIKTNLQIDAGGAFNSQFHTGTKQVFIGDTTLSSGGNLIVDGTLSFADTTSQITFIGDYNSTISGSGSVCSIGIIEVCKEESVLETIRRVSIPTPSPSLGSNLKLTSGTYKISVADTIRPFGFGNSINGFSTAIDTDDPEAPIDTTGGGEVIDTADAGRGNDTIPMGDTAAVDTSVIDTSGGRAPGDTIPGAIDTSSSTDTTVGNDGRMLTMAALQMFENADDNSGGMAYRIGVSDGAELWLNHPSAMLDVDIGNNAFNIDFNLHITSGTVQLGTVDSNSVTAFQDGVKGKLTMDGPDAELNVFGGLVFLDDSVNGPGNIINITDGAINIDAKSITRDALVISSGTQVTFTGGTLTFLNPVTEIDGTDAPEDDFVIQGTLASKNFVGSTINVGTSAGVKVGNATKGGFTFVMPSGIEFGNINVESGSVADRGLKVDNDITIGTLLIDIATNTVDFGSNDLTVKTVIKPISGTLTVDTITLFADVNGFSQIAPGNGTITSNGAVFMQYISRASAGWVYIGFPVQATLADLDLGGASVGYGGGSTGNIYYYDASSSTWVAPSSEGHAFDGRGFAVFLGPPHFGTLPTTISVTGTLIDGARSQQLNYFNTGSAKDDGWNLVSNPYPSILDWESVKPNLTANTNNSVSVWDGSQYASYLSPGINTNGGSRFIAPMQAFFVNVSAAGDNENIDFANADRVTDSTAVLRRVATPMQVKLKVNGDKKYQADETVIYFDNNASDSYDAAYDVNKIMGRLTDVPNIYSLVGNHNLAINGYSNFDTDRVVELGFENQTAGNYTIEMQDGIYDPAWAVYLFDKQTNSFHNLVNGSYSFTHTPSQNTNRFSIHFKQEGSLSTEGNTLDNVITIKTKANELELLFDATAKGIVNIELINLLGQVIYSNNIDVSAQKTVNITSPKSGQLLLIRVTQGNKVFTQKIVR